MLHYLLKEVAITANHCPGKGYTSLHNFRIFRASARKRGGMAEDIVTTRAFVGGFPTRKKGADTIVFVLILRSFTTDFSAAVK